MEFLKSVLSDLIAGLIGAAILAILVYLAHKVGPELGWRWANRLRQLGWPFLASVFLATTLISAIIRRAPPVVLTVLLLLALVSVLLPGRARTYAWRILTGIFFLSTVAFLLVDIRATHREQIVFVVDLAEQELMVFRDILDSLEPELGAGVFLMNVDSSRYAARLDKMVASDSMRWDLVAVDNNMLGILVAKGLVEELSKYRQYNELVPLTLLPSLHYLPRPEGRYHFAPFRPNVKITFYNQRKFAQYGLTPPREWDQLLRVAQVFQQEEGVGRVAIQGYPGKTAAVTVLEFVQAAGGQPSILDDDGSKRAFTFLQRLEPYLVTEHREVSFDTANELLIDDEVYLVSNWTYGIKVVVEEAGKEEIKVYSGWKGPDKEVHVLGGDVLAIPKGAPHPGKAIKLIELLLSKETQETLVSGLAWMPVRLDAFGEIPPSLEPYFQAGSEALAFSVTRPTTPKWTMVEGVLDRAYKELIQEGNDVALLQRYSACLSTIPSQFVHYRVKPGDTLPVIADRHSTALAIVAEACSAIGLRQEVDILAEANGITSRTSVRPGQIVLVPQQQSPTAVD